jgi:hypothetical protein
MSSAPACARHAATASRTAVYQPRRPERTVVNQVVQRHLETWLEETRGRDPEGSPRQSKVTFRRSDPLLVEDATPRGC